MAYSVNSPRVLGHRVFLSLMRDVSILHKSALKISAVRCTLYFSTAGATHRFISDNEVTRRKNKK